MKLNEIAQKDPLVPAKSISTSGVKKVVKLAMQSFKSAISVKGEDKASCQSRVEFVMGGIALLTDLRNALMADHAIDNLKMEAVKKGSEGWRPAKFYGSEAIKSVVDALQQHFTNLTIDNGTYAKPGFRAHQLDAILVMLKSMLNKLQTQLAMANAATKS